MRRLDFDTIVEMIRQQVWAAAGNRYEPSAPPSHPVKIGPPAPPGVLGLEEGKRLALRGAKWGPGRPSGLPGTVRDMLVSTPDTLLEGEDGRLGILARALGQFFGDPLKTQVPHPVASQLMETNRFVGKQYPYQVLTDPATGERLEVPREVMQRGLTLVPEGAHSGARVGSISKALRDNLALPPGKLQVPVQGLDPRVMLQRQQEPGVVWRGGQMAWLRSMARELMEALGGMRPAEPLETDRVVRDNMRETLRVPTIGHPQVTQRLRSGERTRDLTPGLAMFLDFTQSVPKLRDTLPLWAGRRDILPTPDELETFGSFQALRRRMGRTEITPRNPRYIETGTDYSMRHPAQMGKLTPRMIRNDRGYIRPAEEDVKRMEENIARMKGERAKQAEARREEPTSSPVQKDFVRGLGEAAALLSQETDQAAGEWFQGKKGSLRHHALQVQDRLMKAGYPIAAQEAFKVASNLERVEKFLEGEGTVREAADALGYAEEAGRRLLRAKDKLPPGIARQVNRAILRGGRTRRLILRSNPELREEVLARQRSAKDSPLDNVLSPRQRQTEEERSYYHGEGRPDGSSKTGKPRPEDLDTSEFLDEDSSGPKKNMGPLRLWPEEKGVLRKKSLAKQAAEERLLKNKERMLDYRRWASPKYMAAKKFTQQMQLLGKTLRSGVADAELRDSGEMAGKPYVSFYNPRFVVQGKTVPRRYNRQGEEIPFYSKPHPATGAVEEGQLSAGLRRAVNQRGKPGTRKWKATRQALQMYREVRDRAMDLRNLDLMAGQGEPTRKAAKARMQNLASASFKTKLPRGYKSHPPPPEPDRKELERKLGYYLTGLKEYQQDGRPIRPMLGSGRPLQFGLARVTDQKKPLRMDLRVQGRGRAKRSRWTMRSGEDPKPPGFERGIPERVSAKQELWQEVERRIKAHLVDEKGNVVLPFIGGAGEKVDPQVRALALRFLSSFQGQRFVRNKKTRPGEIRRALMSYVRTELGESPSSDAVALKGKYRPAKPKTESGPVNPEVRRQGMLDVRRVLGRMRGAGKKAKSIRRR